MDNGKEIAMSYDFLDAAGSRSFTVHIGNHYKCQQTFRMLDGRDGLECIVPVVHPGTLVFLFIIKKNCDKSSPFCFVFTFIIMDM